MSKTELVILDWAGTAVDYGCFAPVSAFALAFQAFGIQAAAEEIRAPMGMLKRDHIRTMLHMERIRGLWNARHGKDADEAAVEAVYGIFEEKLMESLAQYAVPKPGVLETAAGLREMGVSIGSTTGYTDSMMEVVARRSAALGYAPDAWFSPDAVGGMGRPYPYMIFANMQRFRVSSVDAVVKVGDTVSDVKEGKNAGVRTLGVIEGSSIVGLTESEWDALSPEQKAETAEKARRTFLEAGADAVLDSIGDLPAWLKGNQV